MTSLATKTRIRLSRSRPRFTDSICPSCKRKAVEHRHSLTKVLVNGIYDFATQYKSKARVAIQLSSLGWTRTRWQNFTKLKYWGLIEQPEPKSGFWVLTEKGMLFVCGLTKIPKAVWTWDDEVVEYEGEPLTLAEMWEGMPEYMNRLEFSSVARPHLENMQSEMSL